MTFLEALDKTRGMRAVARPVGSLFRPGLGWRIANDRVEWYDPTAILDVWQYATATPPWPRPRELFGEWEVVNL